MANRNDINIGIRLTSGELIKVIYPLRVFREYETPWLERSGSREMNIDTLETLAVYRPNGVVHLNCRFIVGTWDMGGYMSSKNVEHVIPLHTVAGMEPLSASDVAIGEANLKAEEDARIQKEKENPERYVRLKDLAPILQRLAKLEQVNV